MIEGARTLLPPLKAVALLPVIARSSIFKNLVEDVEHTIQQAQLGQYAVGGRGRLMAVHRRACLDPVVCGVLTFRCSG